VRYYIDAEFFERPGRIDLISIGVVRDDGASFYAENKYFSWQMIGELARVEGRVGDTPRWLLENVKPHLAGDDAEMSQRDMVHWITRLVGDDHHPEFWGYYADYDWVVFCWLFGRMIDLPKHFPKYCLDLKQVMHERSGGLGYADFPDWVTNVGGEAHNALADARVHRNIHRWLEGEGPG
jgi:hypothetical protein